LHNDGFVAELAVEEAVGELGAMVILPPALDGLVDPSAGFGARPPGFRVPLAGLADSTLPKEDDGLLIPERAYQKKKILTTMRATQISVRFT